LENTPLLHCGIEEYLENTAVHYLETLHYNIRKFALQYLKIFEKYCTAVLKNI
jgi:hypothetical protein